MAPIFESAEAQSLAAVFAQRLFYFRRGAEAEAERSGGGVVWGRVGWGRGRGVWGCRLQHAQAGWRRVRSEGVPG